MKTVDSYVLTACIIFQTPCLKYFAGGVLNIMQAVNAKVTRILFSVVAAL